MPRGRVQAGHVVRQLRLGLEVLADVGIMLVLEYVLDKSAVGLGQGHDIGSFVEHRVADADRVGELEDADIRFEQDLDETLGRGRVVLLARDDEGVGRFAVRRGRYFPGRSGRC